MVSVCSADVQTDSCLSSSKAACFLKASCMSEVFTQTLMLPAECAAVSPAATATVNLYSLLISTPLPHSCGECVWTGAADVSQARVKCSRGAVGSPLKA